MLRNKEKRTESQKEKTKGRESGTDGNLARDTIVSV